MSRLDACCRRLITPIYGLEIDTWQEGLLLKLVFPSA
jgi:hypothetical protein